MPLALAVLLWAPAGATGLALLMAAFAFGYLGARAVTLGLRARTSPLDGGRRPLTPPARAICPTAPAPDPRSGSRSGGCAHSPARVG